MKDTSPDPPVRMSWEETKSYLCRDYERLCEVRAERTPYDMGTVWLSQSFICVLLFRCSSHAYRSGYNWISRFLWHLNILVTGADISLPAEIGPGLVIMHPTGTSIMGRIGKNFTVLACAGSGGEVGRHNKVGNWPGVPLIGDDVTFEAHSGVLGPFTIGDRVQLCAGAIVTRDIPDDTVVESPRVRIVTQNYIEDSAK